MKKIKSLLGIGILGALFSTCFGATEIASINQYRYITTSGDNRIGNYVFSEVSNASTMQSRIFYSYGVNYFSGVNQVQAGSYPYTGLVNFPKSGNYIFNYDLFSPNGFSFNINDNLLFHIIGGNELIYRYSSSDFSSFPMVFSENGNYFTFRTDSSLLYNFSEFPFNSIGTLKYCFYGIDYSFSCVFSTGSDYVFKSFYYDPLINDVRFSDGVLIIPLFTQSTPLNGTSSILLYYNDNEDLVYYNLYDCYSSNPNLLSSCNVIDKGYFNNITKSDFSSRSFATSPSSQSELYFFGGNYIFRSFLLNRHSDTSSQFCINHPLNCTSRFSIDTTSSTTTPTFVLIPYTGSTAGGNNGNQSTGLNVVPFSSLYYQCLGPSYNTPDGFPPSFCLNPDGTLINIDDYKDCYYTLSASGDLMENMYCNNNGYVQEMAWVGEGSGGYFSACYGEDCGVMFVFGPNYLDFDSVFNLSTGTIEDMITNITGWVGKCPFPYTDFQLGKDSGFLKLLKSFGLKYDPFVFVNCVIAGFHEGRNTITDMAGLSFLEQPLLHGDTDQHRILFVFLDFVVILGFFGLVAFLKKVF